MNRFVRADPRQRRRRPRCRGGPSTPSRNDVAVADLDARVLVAVLEVLRREPDRAEREEAVVLPDAGAALDHDVRIERRCRGRGSPRDPRSRTAPPARQARAAPAATPARAGRSRASRVSPPAAAGAPPPRAPRPPARRRESARARRGAARAGPRAAAGRPGTTGRRNFVSSKPTTRISSARGSRARRQQPDARGLRQRLQDQHSGHHRLAREVPGEEVLAAGDVLRRDQTPARVVLEDAVHEHERVLRWGSGGRAGRSRLRSWLWLTPRAARGKRALRCGHPPPGAAQSRYGLGAGGSRAAPPRPPAWPSPLRRPWRSRRA